MHWTLTFPALAEQPAGAASPGGPVLQGCHGDDPSASNARFLVRAIRASTLISFVDTRIDAETVAHLTRAGEPWWKVIDARCPRPQGS